MMCLLVQKRWRDSVTTGIIVFAGLFLLFWPDQASTAIRDGLSLCYNVLLPSLFPFFVLSSLVIESGLSQYLGHLLERVMYPLFHVNGTCAAALVLGFLGGYPVGARTAIQLYKNGQCTKIEAERLLAFCNNCGPAFILGVVGTGIFGNGTLGLVLYFVHITASLLVGLIFRFYKCSADCSDVPRKNRQLQISPLSTAFISAVTGAMQSTLNICAFVLSFSVIIRMLMCSGLFSACASVLTILFYPLGLTHFWASRLLTGLLEMTAGVSTLAEGALTGRLSMAAFMLGWAGLSVHCQVMAFSGDSGLSLKTYLLGKFLHGGLSALLISLLARFYSLNDAVSVHLLLQTETLAHMDFQQSLTVSLVSAWLLWVGFFLIVIVLSKKSGGKTGQHGV